MVLSSGLTTDEKYTFLNFTSIMNKRLLFLLAALSLSLSLAAYTEEDLLYLDCELARKSTYQAEKQQRIKTIEAADLDTYSRLLALTIEYQSYSYDTATYYVEKLLDEAQHLQSPEKIVEAQIRHAFIFLSSGLFKESADLLEDMQGVEDCSREVQADYYQTYSRLLYDMADYTHGQLASDYRTEGYRMSEAALRLIDPQDTAFYWSTAAQYAMKQDDIVLAIERFERALASSTISMHDRAIAYSSMGYLYESLQNPERADHYWIEAAVADLRSCTKEAIAMGVVARICFDNDDLTRASTYIQEAMRDANFYNARHRQLDISKIMPIIEQSQLQAQKAQNQRIHRLNLSLYVLLVVLFFLLVLLYNRIRALYRAEKTIQSANERLTEANHIKEECIATFLSNESSVYNRIEKYQRYIKRKTQERRYEELQSVPQYVDVRTLRNDFYKRFDTMFLHIYPQFVEEFNALLRPENRIELRQGELLNAELRIFALMRLGITDNAQIANLLDYSINTIYTYKTRIRNASSLSPEDFHRRLMEI